MKKNNNILFLLMSLFSASAFAAEAQSPTQDIQLPRHQWWVNIAGGVGKGNQNFGGFAGLIDANYRLSEHQLLTARALNTNQLLGDDEFKDIGLMYGLIAKQKYAFASASAGLGVAQYKEYSGGWFSPTKHIATTTTVGIPVEIQLFVTPTPYVGIGIVGFSNINTAKTVSGAMLALQFGNLW